MKQIKQILFFLIFIQILTTSSISSELKDCSIYNKFNPKYLVCKAGNFAKETKNYQSDEWSDAKDKKKITFNKLKKKVIKD